MPIKYACVSRDGKVVGESPVGEQPKLAMTLANVFQSLRANEYHRETITDTEITYHLVSSGKGDIIGCAATKDVQQRIAFAFLDSVEKSVTAPAFEIRNCRKVLEIQLGIANDPASDSINLTAKKLDDLKDIMIRNVDAALKRGDTLAATSRKAEAMKDQAGEMNKKAAEVNRMFWWRNMKFVAICLAAFVALALIIVLIVCNVNFSRC